MLRQFGLGFLACMFLLCGGCTAQQCGSCGSCASSGNFLMSGCSGSEKTLINRLRCEDVQVIKYGDYVRIIFYTDNNFEQGTSNLTLGSHPMLNNLVALLRLYGDPPIMIKAYTDTVRNCCESEQLSQDMADSVLAYFWAHGIPHQQIDARGYGFCDPIASVHTVCGSAFNRRIEISLQQQE